MIFIPYYVDLFGQAYYTVSMSQKQIQELKERIAELKKHWPAHSVPPALLQELDELEEALADALAEDEQEQGNA